MANRADALVFHAIPGLVVQHAAGAAAGVVLSTVPCRARVQVRRVILWLPILPRRSRTGAASAGAAEADEVSLLRSNVDAAGCCQDATDLRPADGDRPHRRPWA